MSQLFLQTVTTGVGLQRVAATLGEAQIERRGVSPASWMALFGRAINLGAGARGGLPLAPPDEKLPWYWLVAVEQLLIQGLPSGAVFNVRMEVVNSSHALPPRHLANLDVKPGSGSLHWAAGGTPAGEAGDEAPGEQEGPGAARAQRHAADCLHPGGVGFWPLPPELQGAELAVEVGGRAQCYRHSLRAACALRGSR